MTKEYSNGEVTIVWKPDLCIHSGICARGLPAVFQPREKPWVNQNNASSEAIINQVNQCPSGALSFLQQQYTKWKIANSSSTKPKKDLN